MLTKTWFWVHSLGLLASASSAYGGGVCQQIETEEHCNRAASCVWSVEEQECVKPWREDGDFPYSATMPEAHNSTLGWSDLKDWGPSVNP